MREALRLREERDQTRTARLAECKRELGRRLFEAFEALPWCTGLGIFRCSSIAESGEPGAWRSLDEVAETFSRADS